MNIAVSFITSFIRYAGCVWLATSFAPVIAPILPAAEIYIRRPLRR